jgi:prefoldin subunit 5
MPLLVYGKNRVKVTSEEWEVKETLEQILNELKEMRSDLKELKAGQGRLQKNIIDYHNDNADKIIEYIDDRTEALNKRVFKVETDIQRLSRQ